MSLLADIAHGETNVADVMFLLAVILAILAAILSFVVSEASRLAWTLGWSAVAAIAFGLMVL